METTKPLKRSLSNESNSTITNPSPTPVVAPGKDADESEWLGWYFETNWNEINQINIDTINSNHLSQIIETINQLNPLFPFLPHTYPTPNFTFFLTYILPKLMIQDAHRDQIYYLIQMLLLRLDTPQSPLSHSNYQPLLNLLPTFKNPNPPLNYSNYLLNVIENFLLTKSDSISEAFPSFHPIITHYIIQYIKSPTSLVRPPPHQLFFSIKSLPSPNLEILVKNGLICDNIQVQKFTLDCLISGCLQGILLSPDLYPYLLHLHHRHIINPLIHPNTSLQLNILFLLFHLATTYPTLLTTSDINYQLSQFKVPPLDETPPTFGIEIFKRITQYLPRCWDTKVRQFGFLILGSLGKIVFNFPDGVYNGDQPILKGDDYPPWLNSEQKLNNSSSMKCISLRSNTYSPVEHLEFLTGELNREFIDHRVHNPITKEESNDKDSHEHRGGKSQGSKPSLGIQPNLDEENGDYQPTQGDYVISDSRYKVLSSRVTGGLSFGIEDLDPQVRIGSLSSLSTLSTHNLKMVPKAIGYALEKLLDPIDTVRTAALDCLIEIASTEAIKAHTFTREQLTELLRPLGAPNRAVRQKIYQLLCLIPIHSFDALTQCLGLFQRQLKPSNFQEDRDLIMLCFKGIGSHFGPTIHIHSILDKTLIASPEGLNFPSDWNFGIYSLCLNYLTKLNDLSRTDEWSSLSDYHQRGVKYVYQHNTSAKLTSIQNYSNVSIIQLESQLIQSISSCLDGNLQDLEQFDTLSDYLTEFYSGQPDWLRMCRLIVDFAKLQPALGRSTTPSVALRRDLDLYKSLIDLGNELDIAFSRPKTGKFMIFYQLIKIIGWWDLIGIYGSKNVKVVDMWIDLITQFTDRIHTNSQDDDSLLDQVVTDFRKQCISPLNSWKSTHDRSFNEIQNFILKGRNIWNKVESPQHWIKLIYGSSLDFVKSLNLTNFCQMKAQVTSPLPNKKQQPLAVEYSVGVMVPFKFIVHNMQSFRLQNIGINIQLSDNQSRFYRLNRLGSWKYLANHSWSFEGDLQLGVPSIDGSFFIQFQLSVIDHQWIDHTPIEFYQLTPLKNIEFNSPDIDFSNDQSVKSLGYWGVWCKFKELKVVS